MCSAGDKTTACFSDFRHQTLSMAPRFFNGGHGGTTFNRLSNGTGTPCFGVIVFAFDFRDPNFMQQKFILTYRKKIDYHQYKCFKSPKKLIPNFSFSIPINKNKRNLSTSLAVKFTRRFFNLLALVEFIVKNVYDGNSGNGNVSVGIFVF
jgi:hypothetical protein